jgi:hypothetical protein
MRKKILLYLSLLVVIAVPCLLYAQTLPNPTVVSFTVTGPFVGGANFTITLANVPDLTKLGPTVTLEGKTLTVTGSGVTTITGKLPEGVSKKGGSVKIKYQGTEVPYTLYVPYIDSIFLPKVGKDAQMMIGGGNFDESSCQVSLPASSITVTSCNQRTISMTIGNQFSGGDVTVTSNGLTSAPFHMEFQMPALTFVENKEGITPGSTISIHAKGLSSVMGENLITLDSALLNIVSLKPKDGLVQVKLPEENAKGSLQLTVNGIESNTIAIDPNLPPILTDSEFSNESGVMTIKVTGKYFSSDVSKVSMSIGSKTGSVTFANMNNIEAEFPSGGYSGCLSVTVYGETSNCLSFNTVRPPVIDGYDDPIVISSENKYEWTLYAENVSDKKDEVSVYVNGVNAEIKSRFLNRIIVRFDQTPDVGEVYIVSEGIESNHMAYDFGQRFYPFISGASSNGKFMYGQTVTITGNYLGLQQYKNDVSINLSGAGLMKDEDTNEPDINITPFKITIRLDDNVKVGTNATLSVSVKGKKSNEVSFVAGQDNKNVLCSPWVNNIQYPDGIMQGSKIRVQGQCFSPDKTSNWVYFDTIKTQPTYANLTTLDVVIPKGAKSNGQIKVETQTGESNQIDYISAENTPNPFTFSFADLGTSALSKIDEEGVIARLQINDTLGEVEMQTLKLKFVYEDDKNNPNSVLKLGSLPLGQINVSFSGMGSKTITPIMVERNGTNNYSLTLHGIRIYPSLTPQTLEFRTTVKPFVLNGAKLHMELDPTTIDNFSGLLIQRDKQEILKLKQKSISSATITFAKSAVTCFDSDPNKANCANPAGDSTNPQTVTPNQPSIPKK